MPQYVYFAHHALVNVSSVRQSFPNQFSSVTIGREAANPVLKGQMPGTKTVSLIFSFGPPRERRPPLLPATHTPDHAAPPSTRGWSSHPAGVTQNPAAITQRGVHISQTTARLANE